MERIGAFTQQRFERPIARPRGGINSQRADVVARLLSLMGEDRMTDEERDHERWEVGAGTREMSKRISERMKYWLGRTRGLSEHEIERLMSEAKDGKNPRALLNWLLKNNYGKNQQKGPAGI